MTSKHLLQPPLPHFEETLIILFPLGAWFVFRFVCLPLQMTLTGSLPLASPFLTEDTLLLAPPKLTDPCLNLLHFPPGITQTAHSHPSLRSWGCQLAEFGLGGSLGRSSKKNSTDFCCTLRPLVPLVYKGFFSKPLGRFNL